MSKSDTQVKDALNRVQSATQDLHKAISDAVARREGGTKADLEGFAQKAKSVADDLKGAMNSQNETVKKHLADAVTHLEATQKHTAEGLRNSGQAFQTSLKKVLSESRASVEKVSEALAAKRAQSKKAAA